MELGCIWKLVACHSLIFSFRWNWTNGAYHTVRQLDGILDLLRHLCISKYWRTREDALYYLTSKMDKRAPPLGGKVLKHIKNKAVYFSFPFLTKCFHGWKWPWITFPGQKYQLSLIFSVTQSTCLSNSAPPFYHHGQSSPVCAPSGPSVHPPAPASSCFPAPHSVFSSIVRVLLPDLSAFITALSCPQGYATLFCPFHWLKEKILVFYMIAVVCLLAIDHIRNSVILLK